MIRNQTGLEVQTEDYCGWMDQAYKFLHMLTSHNLELLSIYLERNKPSRKSPPHSQMLLLYRIYQQQLTYNQQFSSKESKLRQLENSIPSVLYRRFYGRVSERVYIKVLFYLFNKRQLSWCRSNLLKLIHLVDSPHRNNFQHFKILIAQLIAENGKILRMVMGQLVDNNIVSSQEQFLRAMESGRKITKEQPHKTNQNQPSFENPHQNSLLIKKLNVIARRHQDSNMLCGMWGNFASTLQRDIKQNTSDKYNLEESSPSTFTYNLSKFRKVKRKRVSWGGECNERIQEQFLKSRKRIIEKNKFVVESFKDAKKHDVSLGARKNVEILELFAKTEPEREETECLQPKRENQVESKARHKKSENKVVASRHKLNKLKSVSMAAFDNTSEGSLAVSKNLTRRHEITPISISLAASITPLETPPSTLNNLNIPKNKTQIQFSKLRLSLKSSQISKQCLKINKQLIVGQKFNNGRRVSMYNHGNLEHLIRQIQNLQNRPRQLLGECKQRYQSLVSTPRPLYEVWDTKNRKMLKPRQI